MEPPIPTLFANTESLQFLETLGISLATFIYVIAVIVIFDAIMKAIALWKSGRNNQLVWFIFLFILNTAGILPIIYLLGFQKKRS